MPRRMVCEIDTRNPLLFAYTRTKNADLRGQYPEADCLGNGDTQSSPICLRPVKVQSRRHGSGGGGGGRRRRGGGGGGGGGGG